MLLLLFAPNVQGKWVDSNFQIIDLLVPPRAAGVAGTLIFVHIANFATLQPWLHVGSFTCRILIHCILELGITRFCDGLDGLIRDTVFISVFVRPFYTVTVSRQYRF